MTVTTAFGVYLLMTYVKMNFNADVAKDVGTDAAIILANIQFWQKTNKANKRNYHDGRYWTYNSIDAFNEIFNYLTPSKIKTCLKKLEQNNYIVSGNFNKSKYDRTKWYSANENLHLSKLANGLAETDQPIPDSKQHIVNTDNKQQIKNTNNKQEEEYDYGCFVIEIQKD